MALSLRRTLTGFAAGSLIVGGSFAFVTTAAADPTVPAAVPAGAIALHNATAQTGTDCPAGGGAYWHFVFAPNNGSAAFTSISLDLGNEVLTFSGAQIIKNGTQTDNVFVAVPAGHALGDLETGDSSYAFYTGTTPNQFNLSHVCVGTTTTTVEDTTTTTVEDTTTTTVEETTTTTVEDTTTTTVEETTTTTEPETTTTTVEETTTTTVEDSTTSTEPETTTTSIETEVGGVTTFAPTTAAEVKGAVQVSGELPYTGTDTRGLVLAGLAVALGGLLLAGLARTRTSA